jgi:hypothetical protein
LKEQEEEEEKQEKKKKTNQYLKKSVDYQRKSEKPGQNASKIHHAHLPLTSHNLSMKVILLAISCQSFEPTRNQSTLQGDASVFLGLHSSLRIFLPRVLTNETFHTRTNQFNSFCETFPGSALRLTLNSTELQMNPAETA